MQSEMRSAQARNPRSPAPEGWVSPSDARFLRAGGAIPEEPRVCRPSPLVSRLDWAPVDEHGTAQQSCLPADDALIAEAQDAPLAADEGTRARIVGELYKSYYRRVFCFTRRSVRDEEAEEVAHEAFVRLFRVKNLERMSISVAYLLRIAENLLKRRHERAVRYRRVLEQSGIVAGLVETGEQRGESPARSWTGEHAHQDLWVDSARLESVLGQLTQEEQAAVRLIVCEGLDYQAAARSLGVPVSTINNWKHRGLSKLKQLIGRSRARTTDGESLAAG